jgi:hypothetical protein
MTGEHAMTDERTWTAGEREATVGMPHYVADGYIAAKRRHEGTATGMGDLFDRLFGRN